MNDIIEILKSVGGIITDNHFVYTSGKHGSVYVNKDAVYPHTEKSSEIGQLFAEKAKTYPIDVIVAPALGGIILSQWTAYYLSKQLGKEILGVYTEKDAESNQIFKRGYDKLVAGKNILILEDIVNTGGSVVKVINTVKNAGGKISCVGVMVNRSPESFNGKNLELPFFSLGTLPAESFDESSCPLCKTGIPVNTTVGHGKQFLQQKSR
jgi:orotate phosphoribosyltransferase